MHCVNGGEGREDKGMEKEGLRRDRSQIRRRCRDLMGLVDRMRIMCGNSWGTGFAASGRCLRVGVSDPRFFLIFLKTRDAFFLAIRLGMCTGLGAPALKGEKS